MSPNLKPLYEKAIKERDEYAADVARLTKRLAERRSVIEQILTDTFKETMAIYAADGGKMGDTLADKMALRLGQFSEDAITFLKKDVETPIIDDIRERIQMWRDNDDADPFEVLIYLMNALGISDRIPHEKGESPAPRYRSEGERIENEEMNDPPLDPEPAPQPCRHVNLPDGKVIKPNRRSG